MEKKQNVRPLADDALDIVAGGGKTTVDTDDTKTASGYRLEVEGEMVTLYNDGENGYKCTVNGKEYKFSNAEVEEMLRQMLNG